MDMKRKCRLAHYDKYKKYKFPHKKGMSFNAAEINQASNLQNDSESSEKEKTAKTQKSKSDYHKNSASQSTANNIYSQEKKLPDAVHISESKTDDSQRREILKKHAAYKYLSSQSKRNSSNHSLSSQSATGTASSVKSKQNAAKIMSQLKNDVAQNIAMAGKSSYSEQNKRNMFVAADSVKMGNIKRRSITLSSEYQHNFSKQYLGDKKSAENAELLKKRLADKKEYFKLNEIVKKRLENEERTLREEKSLKKKEQNLQTAAKKTNLKKPKAMPKQVNEKNILNSAVTMVGMGSLIKSTASTLNSNDTAKATAKVITAVPEMVIKKSAKNKMQHYLTQKFGNVKTELSISKIKKEAKQRDAKISFYIKYKKRKESANAFFSSAKKGAAGKAAAKSAKSKIGVIAGTAGAGSFIILVIVIMIIVVLIVMLLQPIGFTQKSAAETDDDALTASDDVEKMCMEFLKYKFDIQRMIDQYNYQMKSSYMSEYEYVYDPYGYLVTINKKNQFLIVKEKFWEVNELTEKHTLNLPQMSRHSNYDVIRKSDTISGVITEDDFSFTDFILYAQSAYVKNKYPDDDIEKHADIFFKVDKSWLQTFFDKTIKFGVQSYITYGWYNEPPGDGFKGDEIMEKSVNEFLRENGWYLYCTRTGKCDKNRQGSNYCHGHHVTVYTLDIKSYPEVLNELDVNFSVEDTAYIEDLKGRFQMLNDEIIPSVSATYTGTYFETSATEAPTRPTYINSWMTTTESTAAETTSPIEGTRY